MVLYLYNDHSAAAADDRSHTVRTVPPTDGILTVAGEIIRVTSDGKSVMPSLPQTGVVHGIYTTRGDIRYTLIRPRINREGVPVSCFEERSTILAMRAQLDAADIAIEELNRETHNLRGIYERDALWFLAKNNTEHIKEEES